MLFIFMYFKCVYTVLNRIIRNIVSVFQGVSIFLTPVIKEELYIKEDEEEEEKSEQFEDQVYDRNALEYKSCVDNSQVMYIMFIFSC